MVGPDEAQAAALAAFDAPTFSEEEREETPWARALLIQSQLAKLAAPANPSWLDLPSVSYWRTSY